MKTLLYSVAILFVLLLTGCADAGKDQSVNAGEVVTLDGSTSRASFKFVIEQYTWEQIRGESVTLSDIHAVNPTFVAPSTEKPMTLTFRLTTKERFAGRWVKSFKDTVNIAVKATTLPPVDTTPPVLTLKGQAEVVITQGDDYVDAGASAVDDTDGDITSRIKVDGAVDSTKVGTYTLSYTVSDTAGNAAKAVSRKVIVEVKPDTTPPVITLTGESNITLFKDANYTELGATALDDRDGNVTVTTTGTVDTATVGSYTITYSATDKAGNSASLERTVHVVLPPDTIAPVLTLHGEVNMTLEQGAEYVELGATAIDDSDGNVTVRTTGTVDTSTIGNYTVTYSATDSAGNEANATRTITVIDVTPPVITLNGEANITLEQNAVYTELGATALDAVDGNVSVIISGTVDTGTIGNYTVMYTAQDSAGNEANITRSIIVIDVTPPVLTLNGESNITLEQNAVYTELGATALDGVDGNVTVTTTGTVDTATIGNYTVTYSAQDKAGNESNLTRNITVKDVTPPVITLNGESNITLEQNAPYIELGATAVDGVDGNVTVMITGTVDTATVGNYTITYSATDSAGNEANITRSVEVINSTPTLSSITLESNATTVNVGDTVQLSVVGTYSDGSSNAVDENITYTITPNDSVEMNGSVLVAKKDGNVTVQATVGAVNSNSLNLTITWVVDGHVLPPEPDPVVNNATLLGVDVNDNGVRDDVERWIYKEYKDKHPIYIDVAMQGARTKQIMLKDPTKAKKIHSIMVAPILCESYYKVCIDSPIIKEDKRINSKFFRKIIFNTQERMDKYLQYDDLLSGDSYTVPWCSERKQLCDFNTSKYEE